MQQPNRGAASVATMSYAVGDLVIDPARAQVTRASVEVPLPKLSFDLLMALVEAAPAVVSLDALMDRVWAGVVVSPETVSQRAKLLRDALGDDTKLPRYFMSVRGRGYRLVAPVTPLLPEAAVVTAVPHAVNVAGDDDAANVDTEALPPAAPSRPRWLAPLLLGLAVAIAFGFAWVAKRDDPGSATLGAARPAPITERSIAVMPFKNLGAGPDGEALAFGIAEAVLHQLANLQGLVVIARTSSFALGAEAGDARDVGRTLDVRYLLEGSVQRSGELLRVTAQLIDTRSGTHVWSIRFDKPPDNVFAMQDDIAAQVAKALQLSVTADAAARMAGQGTTRFDAYLAYLQGRALLATGRVSDSERAVAQFEESLRLDPAFVAAAISLAEAEVFAAEYGEPAGRAGRFASASQRAFDAIDKALALDPGYGPAYLLRGYLEAFSDLTKAEASYRRGLQLRPNDARGFAGLAAILFERPDQREEALRMLDRARRIDPLDPAHDVTKSVFLLYDRGDVRAADALLRGVLQRHPQFVPALVRRGELAWCCDGDAATAIELLEQALSIDPGMQWPRRSLVRAYLDTGDVRAAVDVSNESAGLGKMLRLPLLAYEGNWLEAGEASYAALEQGLVTPIDELVAVVSIRRHARRTGQFDRAITVLEKIAGVAWQPDGKPRVAPRPGLRVAGIGLADMLQAGGRPEHARALLDLLIEQMGAELRFGGRTDTWYSHGMSVALALRGERERALDWLRRGVDSGSLAHDAWLIIEGDPAFDALRQDASFAELVQEVRTGNAREAVELAQLRATGRVPRRP